jgi:pectate lyase
MLGKVVAIAGAISIATSMLSGGSINVSAASSNAISITDSEGWLESAYIKWNPVSYADSYNVYVIQNGTSTQLDNELIRLYKDDNGNYYYRADAVGLASGSYTMKVIPVVNGSESSTYAATTSTLSVTSHDRSGFAFSQGTSSGAYEEDGTLNSDAVVLYITEETKDTVTLDVTTSSKGSTTTGTGLQNILNLYKKGYDSRPLDIRIIGQITDFDTMEGGDIVISGSSSSNRISCGITVEGIGDDATADGWGLRIKNASDVEVRNLGFMNCDSDEGDDVGLQQNNDHIWVHNCDFFYGNAGSDADQLKGDGALDTKTSTYVTHSYNHFYDTGKTNLQGMKSESTTNYITYHHNWYDHSDSRHPRIRTCSVHIYNNYFDGNSKYGVGVTLGASAFVENNYFRNCKYPMLISEQGSDVISDWTSLTRDEDLGTFSSENGGIIKAYNNTIIGATSYVTYQTNSTEFDAYEVSSASTQVPGSVVSYQGASTYNNFDTDSSIMYSYTADDPETAMVKVQKYAGRVDGGDFDWEFDDSVDDTSSAVNEELKAAISSYTTNLVSVGSATSDEIVYDDSSNSSSSNDTTDDTSANDESGSSSSSEASDTSNSSSYVIQDGWYYIKNVNSQLYVEVQNDDDSNFGNVCQGTGTGDERQRWYVTNLGDNYITLQNGMSGGRMMDVYYGGTTDGTNIDICDANGYDAQTFKVVETDTTGVYCLTTKCSGDTQAVDVYGWSTEDGGNISTWTYNGLACQQFKFEAISSSSSSDTSSDSTVSESGSYVQNFTTDGLTSDFYSISGNLSTSKGTVTYNGLTLTTALKVESSTSISFEAPASGTLTLVFVESAPSIKIDGTTYNGSDGIITVELEAGSHVLTKASSANLFYMVFDY